MTGKAEIKNKILKSLEACGNFQRTHNFLFQSFHAILRCQLEAFFDHQQNLFFLDTLSNRIKALSKLEGKPNEHLMNFGSFSLFLQTQTLSNKFEVLCLSQCKIDKTWLFGENL